MNKARLPSFSESNSTISRYYMDYYIKLISRKHVLTNEEKTLIWKAYLKSALYFSLGVFGFVCVMYKYYKFCKHTDYFTNNYSLYDSFNYYALGLGSLCLGNFASERSFCGDLKYLVIKYSQIDKEQYNESLLSKSILSSYYKN